MDCRPKCKKYNYKSPRRQHLRKPCDFRSGNDLSDTIPKPQYMKEKKLINWTSLKFKTSLKNEKQACCC